MPALASVVSTYINAVKTALNTGSDLGSSLRGASQNYLRAQDLATVLELLQNALTTGSLTVVSGTTTSVTDGAGTFVPGQQVGHKIRFGASTTTVALRSVEATIIANTDRTLTFGSTLPGTPVAGDTYVIVGNWATDTISKLREGKSLAENPVGNVYGLHRDAMDGLLKFVERLSVTQATGVLTLTGQPLNTETVTIGTKVYTFQTVLTNVDGNVLIGASASASLDNLIAAINLAAGGGTTYAAATTINNFVTAAAGAGDTMDVTARRDPGPAGNSIATTETLTNGSWGSTPLTGGAIGVPRARTFASLTAGTGSTTTSVVLNTRGVSPRIDEFRGLSLTVSGQTRTVTKSDENGVCTLDAALSGAPSAATAVTLSYPYMDFASTRFIAVHPGGQPGDNYRLADLIDQVQTAVTNYVLPT